MAAMFFIPGPTWVRPEILQQMTRPMIGHRSKEFQELFASITANLRPVFGTGQSVFIAACSGTALMEAALVNTVGRRVLVTSCGAFSERWAAIGEALGLEVDRLDSPWGQATDPDALRDRIRGRHSRYDAVTLTHNETSTGVTNDVAALARVVREECPDTLVLVDAVSSLAGIEMRFDDWGLDVCFASVQKGLALPPGITVFAASEQALARARKLPYRGTYLDFLKYRKSADEGSVPTTPSVSHCYALEQQLRDIMAETLEGRFRRHQAMRDLTLTRTAAYAEAVAVADHRSNTVTALRPVRTKPDALRNAMKERGFTLGGGYGEWKETTFRIGHMGDISLADLSSMLDVLDEVASQLT